MEAEEGWGRGGMRRRDGGRGGMGERRDGEEGGDRRDGGRRGMERRVGRGEMEREEGWERRDGGWDGGEVDGERRDIEHHRIEAYQNVLPRYSNVCFNCSKRSSRDALLRHTPSPLGKNCSPLPLFLVE